MALVNLVDQAAAFTYVSAMTGFSPAGPAPLMARVNLDASAWRQAGTVNGSSRWDPQVLSTTPLPLLHLVQLVQLAQAGLALHPVAVVSGAAHAKQPKSPTTPNTARSPKATARPPKPHDTTSSTSPPSAPA